jgi:ATP-binding cassette subfamily B (MDR/TAP) protein 1
MAGLTGKLTKAFEEAAHVATEAMVASRAVAAFGLQATMQAKFSAALETPTRLGLSRARIGGLGQGSAQFFLLAIYACCFWSGAQWINQGVLTFQELMQSFFAIAMAATGLGHASAFTVDAAKAEAAKRSIFALLDRRSAIDPTDESGAQPAQPVSGRLELRDVRFTYPARPEAEVLHGISFTVEPGSTVAIVGPSGSGKSSIVQLLLDFYRPSSGAITLDGVDLREYNVAGLRGVMGWVQQEVSSPGTEVGADAHSR